MLELAERLPCPLLVDEAYVDFADFNCVDLVTQNEKILVSRSLSKSYAPGRAAVRLPGRPAARSSSELIKVKDSYNCDALSIAAATAAIDDQAWLAENRAQDPRHARAARRRAARTGLRRRSPRRLTLSGARIRRSPAKPLYEQLKAAHVLVRYMNYPGWGDGLRISVGTDEQIDACLSLLKSVEWMLEIDQPCLRTATIQRTDRAKRRSAWS